MKFNTLATAAAVCAAIALAGCRYDDAAEGDGANDAALAAGAQDEQTNEFVDGPGAGQDAQQGDLDSLLAQGRPFEELYQRCTDVAFAPVYFGLDSTVISSGEIGKVDAVVQHLTDRQDRVVVVEGHCDERGSNEYNMSLGEARAVILRNYLVESGIAEDRIQTRSYGEERPAVEGTGESAWSKNRRGEFAIFQK